jgi:hypothetical protein
MYKYHKHFPSTGTYILPDPVSKLGPNKQILSTNKPTYSHLQQVLLSIVLVDPYPDLAIPKREMPNTLIQLEKQMRYIMQ